VTLLVFVDNAILSIHQCTSKHLNEGINRRRSEFIQEPVRFQQLHAKCHDGTAGIIGPETEFDEMGIECLALAVIDSRTVCCVHADNSYRC
jgi:hypothetical protein